MDSTEIGILVGSALLHQAFFLSIRGDSRGDGAKLKSCYLSHLHCAVAVTSCMVYWATQPVELSSAVWMVEGPPGWNSQWMRWTIAFSVPPPHQAGVGAGRSTHVGRMSRTVTALARRLTAWPMILQKRREPDCRQKHAQRIVTLTTATGSRRGTPLRDPTPLSIHMGGGGGVLPLPTNHGYSW